MKTGSLLISESWYRLFAVLVHEKVISDVDEGELEYAGGSLKEETSSLVWVRSIQGTFGSYKVAKLLRLSQPSTHIVHRLPRPRLLVRGPVWQEYFRAAALRFASFAIDPRSYEIDIIAVDGAAYQQRLRSTAFDYVYCSSSEAIETMRFGYRLLSHEDAALTGCERSILEHIDREDRKEVEMKPVRRLLEAPLCPRNWS